MNKFQKSVKNLEILLPPSFIGVCDLIIKIDLKIEAHIYLWIFSLEKTKGKQTVELFSSPISNKQISTSIVFLFQATRVHYF